MVTQANEVKAGAATGAMVNTAEIARMAGLSREHVTDRLTKRPDFPRPAVNISRRTRFWRRADVLAWMRGK